MSDTIFALASAQGRAGVAVVRVSGPACFSAVGCMMESVPISRGLRRIVDADGAMLDEALVLAFRDGHSFTGENVVELHLHGSIAVIGAVLRRLGQLDGLRPAEAGEFTRRALENGKLDLAQVEGLADLIDAETEGQRRQAQRVLSGELGKLADGWRENLLRAAALIEATIDFADEEVPVDVAPEVRVLVSRVASEMEIQAAGVLAAERLRNGFEVAIVGAPNVGKSTLLNALAGREAAITSEIAGTTRDIIEVRMDIGGYAVTVLDTAGVRETNDIIEKKGVNLALARAAQSDIAVFLTLPGELPPFDPRLGDLVVAAKVDVHPQEGLGVSGTTREGIDALLEAVKTELGRRAGQIGVAMRERHRLALSRSVSMLRVAGDMMAEEGYMADLVAEELRGAIRAVDSLVGRIDVEDVLGEIFASFCIGK